MSTYFLHQAKHNANTGVWDKGIVIKESKPTDKENYADALQGYHSYLGAYAYGHDANTDFVAAYIFDDMGNRLKGEVWNGRQSGDSEDGGEG